MRIPWIFTILLWKCINLKRLVVDVKVHQGQVVFQKAPSNSSLLPIFPIFWHWCWLFYSHKQWTPDDFSMHKRRQKYYIQGTFTAAFQADVFGKSLIGSQLFVLHTLRLFFEKNKNLSLVCCFFMYSKCVCHYIKLSFRDKLTNTLISFPCVLKRLFCLTLSHWND